MTSFRHRGPFTTARRDSRDFRGRSLRARARRFAKRRSDSLITIGAEWACSARRLIRCYGTPRRRRLLEILDSQELPYEYNKAENMLTMKDTRSRIIFRPVDDFERLRGTNLAWFGLDELTYSPEGAWLRLEGRLRDPQARSGCAGSRHGRRRATTGFIGNSSRTRWRDTARSSRKPNENRYRAGQGSGLLRTAEEQLR